MIEAWKSKMPVIKIKLLKTLNIYIFKLKTHLEDRDNNVTSVRCAVLECCRMYIAASRKNIRVRV